MDLLVVVLFIRTITQTGESIANSTHGIGLTVRPGDDHSVHLRAAEEVILLWHFGTVPILRPKGNRLSFL